MTKPLNAQTIDALLPQTQCTQCGYDGCLPYAQAIAQGEADINRCPPGGDETIRALSALVGAPVKPLNPECGQTKPLMVAVIDESHCIGCALCIKACPVDAIVGANKRMHTILPDWCTGCELCVAPCPVDCIEMVPVTDPQLQWSPERAQISRIRHQRLKTRREQQSEQALKAPEVTKHLSTPSGEPASKADVIAAALAKARQQRLAAKS
ncbi:electron transport complex subunit RsxB [Orrella sp. 11846]|uniref:electron transport complex subunit RsxB n=1 Tax=Orrella sp. 11846 TaxID=3409913 RepID=UPI003B5BED2D